MGLFKNWRAKRAAKRKLKEQAHEAEQKEVVLTEEKVSEQRREPVVEDKKTTIPKEEKVVAAETKEPKLENSLEEDETTKETKPRYHVTQNKNKNNPNFKRWGVKLSNSKKTIKFHDTQAEAIKHAEMLAKNNDTTFVIHKVDGKIRKQNY